LKTLEPFVIGAWEMVFIMDNDQLIKHLNFEEFISDGTIKSELLKLVIYLKDFV